MKKIILSIFLACLAALAAHAQDPNVRVEKMPVNVKINGSDVWFIEPYIKDSIFCDSTEQQCLLESKRLEKVQVYHLADPAMFAGWGSDAYGNDYRVLLLTSLYETGVSTLGYTKGTARYKDLTTIVVQYTEKQVVLDRKTKEISTRIVDGTIDIERGVIVAFLILMAIVLIAGMYFSVSKLSHPMGVYVFILLLVVFILFKSSWEYFDIFPAVNEKMTTEVNYLYSQGGVIVGLFLIGCVFAYYLISFKIDDQLSEEAARQRYIKAHPKAEIPTDDQCIAFTKKQILYRHRITFVLLYMILIFILYMMTGDTALTAQVMLVSIGVLGAGWILYCSWKK